MASSHTTDFQAEADRVAQTSGLNPTTDRCVVLRRCPIYFAAIKFLRVLRLSLNAILAGAANDGNGGPQYATAPSRRMTGLVTFAASPEIHFCTCARRTQLSALASAALAQGRSVRSAVVGVGRSEGPESALIAKMCMTRHR
jgi:hypothetical protein